MDKIGHPPHILLVEDNDMEVLLAKRALQEFGAAVCLSVARDVDEAWASLKPRDPLGPASRPDLILLDLNLPRASGMELLRRMRGDDTLRGIRVVVLTSSKSEADRLRALEYGADGFATKPLDFREFVALLQSIVLRKPS